MLTTSAFAATGAGSGMDPQYVKPSGSNTDFSSRNSDVGIAIGIQQMAGNEYSVSALTSEEEAERERWRIKSDGLATVIKHFAQSYPMPYEPAGGQGLLYILPSHISGAQYVYCVGTSGNFSRASMVSSMAAGAYSVNYSVSDRLYAKAIAGVTDSNPNPNISAADIDSIVATITEGQAKDLIGYIFAGCADYRQNSIADAINRRYKEVYAHGVDDLRKTPNLMSARQACNYAAIILSLSKLLPSENQPVYTGYVKDYLCNVLSGASYSPIVITTELCFATEWKGDGSYCNWRTIPEQIALHTGVDVNKVRNVPASLPGALSSMLIDTNPAQSIIRAASDSNYGANYGGAIGSTQMLGLSSKGNDLGSYNCRSITSIEQAVIAEVAGNYGWTLPKNGPWGCGIFGAEEAVQPIKVIPPTSDATITGMGSVSIEAGPPSQIEKVGAYSTNFDLTVKVNLKAEYSAELSDEQNNEYYKTQGAGFANTLGWLQEMRDRGQNFPNPSVEIWVSQNEGFPALSDTVSKNLIDETYGYKNDGLVKGVNAKGYEVSPRELEAATGASFNWNALNLQEYAAFKDPGIEGAVVSKMPSGSIRIEFTDLGAAYAYFQKSNGTLTFDISVPGNGTLDTDSSVNQHWFIVGAKVTMSGPKSLLDMNTITTVDTGLDSKPKYAYATIVAKPEEKPFYYSTYQDPYSEFKQGTVPTTGGGSDEEFNSMTGTPTFTDTGVRVDFSGTKYENAGRYYQYFASGGSEFVVQFDGEYVESANASRSYSASYTAVTCDHNWDACQAPHTHGSKPPVPCSTCHQTYHCAHNQHQVSDSFSWTQSVTGFSYVKITNLKVWKLSEAKLDGTRELLDTDEVMATVQSVAPSVSYNIAANDSAASGRLVYSYETAQKDSVTIPGTPKASSNVCATHTTDNADDLEAKIAGKTVNATCISDFIVLRTSNGDQSILYYEYKSKNEPEVGIRSGDSFSANPIEFDKVPYETIWKNNSQTSEGCGLPEDGITYGGYNGNYSSVSTKYKSSGHSSNIDFNSTTAYKNKSVMSGSWVQITEKPTQKFRLLNDTLVIPDYKQNGEYLLGTSVVFYENIINRGDKTPNFPIVPQSDFGGKLGFTLTTTYSSDHDKINDVVVYNPVSNQNAIIVSLPKERDQRVATHAVPGVDKGAGCPGDSSCPYLKNECTATEHVHTEACYELLEYEVHGPNNVHEHTAECTYHYSGPNTTGWAHIHCIGGCRDFEGYCTGNRATCSLCQNNVPFDNNTYPNDSQYQTGGGYYLWYHDAGCQYSGQTHTSTSSTSCTYCGHNCGYLAGNGGEKVYDCNNLPLNKHVCGGSGSAGGSITTGQSKDFNYTGGVQSITLDPGTYKLETWGAQGGSGSGTGGLGGYSTGQITLTSTTTLYVAVGGQGGTDRSTTNGGFNGGGYSVAYGSGGGGATHFATASGTLASLSGNKNAVLIVAGGGGGEAGRSDRPGGAGGGLEGAAGYSGCGGPGHGGTQTAAGASGQNGSAAGFGYGGSQTAFGSNGGAGGGGGYYGGGAGGNDYSSYSDNDDSGGGGGSGYISASLTAASTTAGTRSGNGYARITAVAVTPTVTCYTMNKALLSCADPHHAYSYNWKTYTYGLRHTSGRICTGRSCTDTTNLVFPTQEGYTVAQCAAGSIVRHANGNVHLTTTTGTCSYCGSTYKEVLSAAQAVDRVPDASEYSCYAYGDPRCWSPCGNNANHQKYVTEVVDNGTTYKMGDFINIDWPFTIYFPNTGDFYGTGAEWSSETSAERGHGYTNGMDATEWTKTKWVEFPFAVVYNNQTFLAYERIYLEVPKTVFEFYVPLHDSEVASAEIKFGSVAINAQNGETLECGANRDHNIQTITYAGKPMAHHHNADKRTYIDVVGRIGNLALNDTGDFRFSNFFKQATSGWIVDNIVHTVDFTKQNNILLDKIDVRGVTIGSTGVAGNTHGTRPERGSIGKISSFPLSPATNNITALQKQPIRVGYDSYFDLTTLGNYYGNTVYDDGGDAVGQNLVLVKPHYYRLDLDSGNYQPVDVYMDVNGNKVLINDNDSNTVAYNGTNAQVNLNWVEEQARRNYTGSEVTNSKAVAGANTWVELPSSSTWVYGNYNLLNLTQRNRTFVGSEYTYSDKGNWVAHKDPSDRLPGTLAALQGARWHFNVGLPSSSVFVYSGQEASQANIDACASGNAVIFCALEIYAQGEVWTLAYDGSNVNQPFTVTPGGKVYDPVIPYPAGKNPKGEEMPIVEIISINHSSKEDLNTSGTQ